MLADLGDLEVNLEFMHQPTLVIALKQLKFELRSELANKLDMALSWVQFELILTASTIPNLQTIMQRLKELADQQKRASQRALATFFRWQQPLQPFPPRDKPTLSCKWSEYR